MKSAFIFVSFLSITLANDLFIGEWKEDPYKRQNTNNFLYARGELFSRKKNFVICSIRCNYTKCIIIIIFSGLNFFFRTVAANDMSWFATMKASKDVNGSFIETGKRK